MKRRNSISINDSEDQLILDQGIYDEENKRAVARITGFVKAENGLFERFDEVIYNYVYALKDIQEMLTGAGWKEVAFNPVNDFAEPEKESRVFIIAKK